MAWLSQCNRSWRLTFLLLLMLALSGPWWFDRIWVPDPYSCSAPNLRLDENFCGFPMSITWFYATFLDEIAYLLKELTAGTIRLAEAARNGLLIGWLTLLLLPVLTTALIILRGEHRGGYLFHQVGLGVSALIAGVLGVVDLSDASWILWGLWLYITSALGLLGLEIFVFRRNRRTIHV